MNSKESVSKAAEMVTNFLIAGARDGTLQTVEIGDLNPRDVSHGPTLLPWIKMTNDLERIYYGEDDGTDITLGVVDASVTSFDLAEFAAKKGVSYEELFEQDEYVLEHLAAQRRQEMIDRILSNPTDLLEILGINVADKLAEANI